MFQFAVGSGVGVGVGLIVGEGAGISVGLDIIFEAAKIDTGINKKRSKIANKNHLDFQKCFLSGSAGRFPAGIGNGWAACSLGFVGSGVGGVGLCGLSANADGPGGVTGIEGLFC